MARRRRESGTRRRLRPAVAGTTIPAKRQKMSCHSVQKACAADSRGYAAAYSGESLQPSVECDEKRRQPEKWVVALESKVRKKK